MNVPVFDLQDQTRLLSEDLEKAVVNVVRSGSYILGPEVEALEKELADLLRVKHTLGVTSGTDALLMALIAIGVGPGDEVVTTSFSFFATVGSILRLGAKPVFADIDADSFNINAAAVEAATTSKTRALLPVHLYGQCANMTELLGFAAQRDIVVIEDAAQAICTTHSEGKTAGSMGAIGTLSFYPSKNLGAFGDAGLVMTQSDTLAEKLSQLRNHGSAERYYHSLVGGNFRMDAFQAAVLRTKLPKLGEWTERRRKIASRYQELFEQSGILQSTELRPPTESSYNSGRFPHVYHQYVIAAPKRDELKNYLQSQGIGTAIYYPLPIHLQKACEELGYQPGSLPNTERAAREVLALPMFPELKDEAQCRVVEKIAEFYGARGVG